MADYCVQGCFAFRCTSAECALIEEVFDIAARLMNDEDGIAPSAAFLSAFPATSADDRLSGFRSIFSDPQYPEIGAAFDQGVDQVQPTLHEARFWSDTDFQPYPVAEIIRHCCQDTLAKTPVGFAWAQSCSRPRVDGFGGGWCAIFCDRIVIETTSDALAQALALE
ncbi:hypothetical protein [Sphingobium boeckii]|uniref:Uncharacterized protein n=1 Tax=Sphingobium boeckii TaxID=1082345 RepID=A0A7W9AIJ1_9SPHN|nr:hypothetical protein [Sphingobium boeckii]MBB5686317.1 hypothetical protein [Sphingobium boeckii]